MGARVLVGLSWLGYSGNAMSIIQHGHLRIHFAALAEPLRVQAQQCGLRLDPGQVDVLQACADSIVRLRIHGVITDGECHKANQRLFKAIKSAVSAGEKHAHNV